MIEQHRSVFLTKKQDNQNPDTFHFIQIDLKVTHNFHGRYAKIKFSDRKFTIIFHIEVQFVYFAMVTTKINMLYFR